MSQPPRKKLRKGTHSCLECRKRKVRCTFDGGSNDKSCDGCTERKTACIGQGDARESSGQPHETMQDRLERLETTVLSLSDTVLWLRRNEEARTPATTVSAATAASHCSRIGSSITSPAVHINETHHNLSEHEHADKIDDDDTDMPDTQPAYVNSLFNNHILSSAAIESVVTSFVAENARATSWESHAHSRLSVLIPSREDVLTITAAAADWWSIHNTVLPSVSIVSKQSLLDRREELVDGYASSASIAAWLVFLSITILQLPQDFDASVLHSVDNTQKFIQDTVKEVDLYVSNDSSLRTVDGIECAFMFSKLATYLGRPKKGWLILRRALTFAQLLNLHGSTKALRRIETQQHSSPETVTHLRARSSLWKSLAGFDRFLSLLLHLPTATNDTITPSETNSDDPNIKLKQVLLAQSEIANRLCHRDQLENDAEAHEESKKIIQDLETLGQTQSKEWWNMFRSATFDFRNITSVLLQINHHYLMIRAQLPNIIGVEPNVHYQANVATCMKACRDLLKRYTAVRTCLTTGNFLSRTCEIQVFMACMVLLLHRNKHTQSPALRLPTSDRPDGESDAALISNAKAAMAQAPIGLTGSFTQEMVSSLDRVQACLDGTVDQPEVVQVRVPLLGNITICRTNSDHDTHNSGMELGTRDSEGMTSTSASTSQPFRWDETLWDYPSGVDLLEEALSW